MTNQNQMIKKIFLISLGLISLDFYSFSQSIRINEAMSSNSVFIDEDGDTPDWFELFNYGNTQISLDNWSVSDKNDNPTKWKFPNISIEPGEYLLVWASDKDRSSASFRTLINRGDDFKYILPTSDVLSSWNTLSFNDTDWLSGSSGFGYGDGDDQTLIPNGTLSIFLRRKFIINDKSNVESIILDVDYDDAFVAYINGIEIGRKNIGGNPPSFNAVPFTDHESAIYKGGSPDRITISDVDDILNDGENIFSVQAHNISNTSSDFTIIPFLSVSLKSPDNNLGINPPEILGLDDANLHTNFKISSGGETLSLYDNNVNLIDKLVVENISSDVSIGISSQNETVNYNIPTPGYENSSISFTGSNFTKIIFSDEGGPSNELNLSLSGHNINEVIRYTTDATEPNENSLIYNEPINIKSTTVIRARVFQEGYIPSSVQSRTYLFNISHDLPVISLVTDPKNLFDKDIGIYSFGDSFDQNYPYFGANFWEDWERPIHLSLYDLSGDLEVEYNLGVKIFGGWSRGQAQRSFSLFARNKYGTSEIDYKLFPQLDYSNFQSFILRNSGQDWLRTSLKDAALTGLLKGTGLDYQAYRPVATYINGNYWGLYNMREKVNEHFIASKHNVEADEIDILTNNSELVHGKTDDYDDLINFINSTNLSFGQNFDYVEDQIDIDNYIMYQVAQIYFNNHDWPGNNIKYWKHKDGKWKWIIYDTDFGFGSHPSWLDYHFNTLGFALDENGPNWPNPPWSTFLFRKMVENNIFRDKFINRFADELNSRFLPEKFSEHIDSLISKIHSEMPAHFNRWSNNVQNWDYTESVNKMKNFSENRAFHCRNHIMSVFEIPAFHELLLDIDDVDMGEIEINNNLIINEYDWKGNYFETVPIKLVAKPKPGYAFSHWTDMYNVLNQNIDLNSAEINFDVKRSTKLKPNFIVAPLAIENKENRYTLYPNPARDNIRLILDDYTKVEGVYFIDFTGKKMKPKRVNRIKNELDINISDLPEGLYVLELMIKGDINKFKVVIER